MRLSFLRSKVVIMENIGKKLQTSKETNSSEKDHNKRIMIHGVPKTQILHFARKYTLKRSKRRFEFLKRKL
jgi:hypothetical protein